MISNASYDRDNGKFECKVKAGGSGANLHVQRYILTVLTAPHQPDILPSSHVILTEGKKQELVCSSTGGSPDPQVKWYKQGKDSLVRHTDLCDITSFIYDISLVIHNIFYFH